MTVIFGSVAYSSAGRVISPLAIASFPVRYQFDMMTNWVEACIMGQLISDPYCPTTPSGCLVRWHVR